MEEDYFYSSRQGILGPKGKIAEVGFYNFKGAPFFDVFDNNGKIVRKDVCCWYIGESHHNWEDSDVERIVKEAVDESQ